MGNEFTVFKYGAPFLGGWVAAVGRILRPGFYLIDERAFHVDAHYPCSSDPGEARADFNLGDVNGTTCTPEFLEFATKTLEDLGHSVSINFPYYGGYLTRRHSDPARGVESIFVEINKRMFIDTNSFKRTDGFSAVKAAMDRLIEEICRYAAE